MGGPLSTHSSPSHAAWMSGRKAIRGPRHQHSSMLTLFGLEQRIRKLAGDGLPGSVVCCLAVTVAYGEPFVLRRAAGQLQEDVLGSCSRKACFCLPSDCRRCLEEVGDRARGVKTYRTLDGGGEGLALKISPRRLGLLTAKLAIFYRISFNSITGAPGNSKFSLPR